MALDFPFFAQFPTTESAFTIQAPGGGGVAIEGVADGINPENNSGGTGVKGIGGGRGNFSRGVFGEGDIGVVGSGRVGVYGAASEAGVWGKAEGPVALAGRFEGDVEVTGDIRLVNADCAEEFDISDAEAIEPGTVMVIDEKGALQQSRQAYDKKVAGVISGARGYRPGIVLDKQTAQSSRMPLALLGKVYCRVDAECAPIEVGDLLTTSRTPGHAMKATDPARAFGAVLGKALRAVEQGQTLIPILIALQ
jgi:hypothetical protein